MNCTTTQELFSDFYDGGLSHEERRALEEHLERCPSCRTEYGHYSTSLQVLRASAPVETTQVFVTSLRAAASSHIERRTLLSETGVEPEKIEVRVEVAPRWIPWALAAVTLLAFGVGYLVADRGARRDYEARLAARIEQARRESARPPEPPPDPEKILAGHGLVKEGDRWIPRWIRDGLAEGRVLVQAGLKERKEAFDLLAKEFPAPVPPTPVAAAVPMVEEVLDKAGYTKSGDVYVPKPWAEKLGQGFVMVEVDQWKTKQDFIDEFVNAAGLVNVAGKWVPREQAEALKARPSVRRPEAVAANELTRALEDLEIGIPMSHGGLTVWPLLSKVLPGEAPFLPLHAALGPGKIEIVDKGAVSSVEVRNPLDQDVFLLAGEILAGGRCARAVAGDSIVPRKKTVAVPVVCVEPSAWKGGEPRFGDGSGHYVAPPSVRRALLAELGQGAVWSMLVPRLEKGRGGQAELFRRHAAAIAEVRAALAELPRREPAAVGMVVSLGDAVAHAEIFRDPALFAAYYGRLVSAAALDLLERPAEPSRLPACPNSERGVKDFLDGLFRGTIERLEDGYRLRRDGAVLAGASGEPGAIRHAAFFAAEAPSPARLAASAPREKMAKVLAEIEARLKAAAPSQRIAAARECGALPAAEAAAILLRHLGETDASVRSVVLRELGATGDARAVEPLVQLASKSRANAALYAEAVRALAKLGQADAVDPLLKQVDAGGGEPARLVIAALPELLLQVRAREVLERAAGRLVSIYEAADAASRGDIVDPMAKGMTPEEARQVADAARTSLRQLTGRDFDGPAGYRTWWNVRDNKDKFLRERTGK